MDRRYGVVIVGDGVAGLTAARFAARCGHSTLILGSGMPGGSLLNVEEIEDFPGTPGTVAGYELCPRLQEQAMESGAEVEASMVETLERRNDMWHVTTADGLYRAGAVIVATGLRDGGLGVPGEERLVGRGVSKCASCDGPLFSGQVVGVVGDGDYALQEALAVARHAAQVIVFREQAWTFAQDVYSQRIEAEPAIRIRDRVVVKEVMGDNAVSAVCVRDLTEGKDEYIVVQGLFVYTVGIPETRFLTGMLDLDVSGHIPVDCMMQTPLAGLFAAGDVRSGAVCHAIAAAGDGATAAIAADHFLRELAAVAPRSGSAGLSTPADRGR